MDSLVTDEWLQALDWNEIVAAIENEALSDPGKTIVRSFANESGWAVNADSASLRQENLREVMGLATVTALWRPLRGLGAVSESLSRLSRDGVLEVEEILLLRGWLQAFDSWVHAPQKEWKAPLFSAAIASILDPFAPLRAVNRVFTSENELSLRASPRLYELTNQIRAVRLEIEQTLEELAKSYSEQGLLQDRVSDQRDGRFVLPVRISAQGRVDGIVYGASVSRHTVFIEPREVEGLNNKLRRLENERSEEVFRILSELSSELRPFGPEIEASVAVLAHWDAVQAKARYGCRFGGKPATVVKGRRFLLEGIAHPLLWGSIEESQIERNTIELGDLHQALLITGPNTGGKTVLLKAIGLAAVFARVGIPYPATGRVEVPFINQFFVDLGDPQSLGRRISSFSGHVLAMKRILEMVSEQSLVLMDELNTATDPEEGSALARAFLESCLERGALIVSTTHDPGLKTLAFDDMRILNASMAFDESTSRPTYRLEPGFPGRSRALETAERLGLPKQVLERAQVLVSRAHRELEERLGSLERNLKETEALRREATRLKDEAALLRDEWLGRTRKEFGGLLDRFRQKLQHVQAQAQEEVRAALKRVAESRSSKSIEAERLLVSASLTQAAEKLEKSLGEEAPEIIETEALASKGVKEEACEPHKVGDIVRIPRFKAFARVEEASEGRLKIRLIAPGSSGRSHSTLSVNAKPNEVERPTNKELAAAGFLKSQDKPIASIEAPLSLETVAHELDIRGRRTDEAMTALCSYIDQAFRSGRAQATIIHGLGTGALKIATLEILKSLTYVKSFRDGGMGHGGAGATIVEFDQG